MSIKDWWRRRGHEPAESTLEIEDLFVLGRYEEAEQRLQARLARRPDDLRSQLLLGDLLARTDRREMATQHYLAVADFYAEDGFYDRSLAVLSKLQKLTPEDQEIPRRISKLEQAKNLAEKRQQAIRGLLESGRSGGAELGSNVLQLERLWENLSRSGFVAALDVEQAKRFFAAGDLDRAPSGTTLAEEGSREPGAFLLLSGEVEVTCTEPDATRRTLGLLEAGDLFGERALLEQKPWPAHYEARRDVIMVRFDRSDLEAALAGNPNPRALVNALRSQGNDDWIVRQVEQMRGGGRS